MVLGIRAKETLGSKKTLTRLQTNSAKRETEERVWKFNVETNLMYEPDVWGLPCALKCAERGRNSIFNAFLSLQGRCLRDLCWFLTALLGAGAKRGWEGQKTGLVLEKLRWNDSQRFLWSQSTHRRWDLNERIVEHTPAPFLCPCSWLGVNLIQIHPHQNQPSCFSRG